LIHKTTEKNWRFKLPRSHHSTHTHSKNDKTNGLASQETWDLRAIRSCDWAELAEDHKEIVRQLDLLKATPKLVEGNSKPTIICIRLQQLFAQHCAKERRLLYPPLSCYLDSNVCKLLTQEHEEISNIMRKIAEDIRVDDKATHWESMSQLDQLLRSHFSKEENVLFWYLDVQLVKTRSSIELPS